MRKRAKSKHSKPELLKHNNLRTFKELKSTNLRTNTTMAQVSANAVTKFNDWKIRNLGKYAVFQLTKDGEIDITHFGESAQEGKDDVTTWNEFVQKELKDDEPCWVTYHFGFTKKDGSRRGKTLLIQWIPSKSQAKKKMQYAMWSTTLKQSLQGIHCTLQAGNWDEVDWENVIERVSRFEKDD